MTNAWDHLPNAAHIDRIVASVKLYPTLWDQAREQAWSPILVLIAYDDSAKYLELSVDQLQMMYLLNEHPACLLLQPVVQVFAMERELALG